MLILPLALAQPLLSQDLKVIVRMNDELLYMAYVLVNGRQVALTDSLGVAYIDTERLKNGDEISAVYIGTSGPSFSYNRELRQSGVCVIEMTPEFSLDEVVVRSDLTGWDIFKKYTHIPLVYEKRHEARVRFTFTQSLVGEEDRVIEGTALIAKEVSRLSFWNYERYDQNVLLLTLDDTTGLKRQILTDLFFTLQVANGAAYRIGIDAYRDPDSPQFRSDDGRILFDFRHRGTEGNHRIFEVTNEAYTMGSSRPLRYLYRVDNRSKNILTSESTHILPLSRYNQRTNATYEMYRLRWLKPATAYLESVSPETKETFTMSAWEIGYNNLTRRERKMLYDKDELQQQKWDKRETKRLARRERQKKLLILDEIDRRNY